MNVLPYRIRGTRKCNVGNTTPPELISEAAIQERVTELAGQISADYADKGDIVLIGVLKGAFILLADLSRQLTIPRTIEFIAVSSYGSGSVQSGAVRLVMDVRGNIEGRDVLIVEDIVDTGHTLKYLIGILESHNPASIRVLARLGRFAVIGTYRDDGGATETVYRRDL